MTQEALGAKVGLKRLAILNLEAGRFDTGVIRLNRIAIALCTTISELALMTEDDRKEWMGTEDHLAGLKPGPAAYNAGCRCAKCKKLNKDRQDRYQEKLRERERRERLVAEWHDAKPGDPAHGTELHDWLGMTKDQYQEWVTSDKLPGDSA